MRFMGDDRRKKRQEQKLKRRWRTNGGICTGF
jgi:hypothetical protein